MNGFIYKITNKLNNKVYIGQTIQKPIERFYQHCAKKCDKYILNMVIHKAIFKYGKDNFTFEVIEEVPRQQLNEREEYWIKYYNSYTDGYNSTKGGQKGNKPFKNIDNKAIIEQYQQGKSLRTIGKMFNIDKATVKSILIRNNIKLRTTRTYKLSQEDRANIISDFKQGLSRNTIVSKWNISKSYLSQLINSQRRI